MNLQDEFRYLVSGYYGVQTMDEYGLKVYILKDIENYIRDYIKVNFIQSFNYKEEADKMEQNPLIVKLQDSLLVLPKVNAPLELILLVKAKINKIKKEV